MATFILLFSLNLDHSHFDSSWEKIDWLLLESKREEIVKEVRQNKLFPNVSWNNSLCSLPYKFPPVSHNTNDICIYKDERKGQYYRNILEISKLLFSCIN